VKLEEPQKPAAVPPPSIQPWYVLVFVVSVIAVLAVLSIVIPKGGLTLPGITIADRELTGEYTFYFPRWEDFFTPDTTKAKDIDEILADLNADIDTLNAADTNGGDFRKAADMGRPPKTLQYPNDDPSVLFPVFEALEQSMNGKKPVRIMHFGDSQIEGDRMSALFRARIQEKFGGTGPGLVSAKPLTSSMSVVVEYSESMQRFAQYGGVDKSVTHRRYGAMATFSRFAPIVPDSAYAETELQTGWVSLSVSRAAFATSKNYSNLKMYYGFNRSDVNVKVFLDDVLFADDNIPANKSMNVKHWHFGKTPNKIMIIMEGFDSPDIYGFSMESDGGVALDNVSMRGSSGTSFSALERVPFKPMLDSLNPKLLLLQYGGNSVPYIEDEKSAQSYGRSFKNQIEYLKGLMPGVGVIVIGPSDMSTKIEGRMQSYPNLVHVRDALRQAAFDAGAGFFDIYEAMGGQNSMLEWVEADPPLAAPDYVHFSPQGARIIAETFIKSFMADYEAYHRARIN
jgi:lysophospholipase L1-like esterase